MGGGAARAGGASGDVAGHGVPSVAAGAGKANGTASAATSTNQSSARQKRARSVSGERPEGNNAAAMKRARQAPPASAGVLGGAMASAGAVHNAADQPVVGATTKTLLALRTRVVDRLAALDKRLAAVNSTLRKNALGVGTGVGAVLMRAKGSSAGRRARKRTDRESEKSGLSVRLAQRRAKRRLLQLVRVTSSVGNWAQGGAVAGAAAATASPRPASGAPAAKASPSGRRSRGAARSSWRTRVRACTPTQAATARATLLTSCMTHLLKGGAYTREHLRREVRQRFARLAKAVAAGVGSAAGAAPVNVWNVNHPLDVDGIMAGFDATFEMLVTLGLLQAGAGDRGAGTEAGIGDGGGGGSTSGGVQGEVASPTPLVVWRIHQSQNEMLGRVEHHLVRARRSANYAAVDRAHAVCCVLVCLERVRQASLVQLRKIKSDLLAHEAALRERLGLPPVASTAPTGATPASVATAAAAASSVVVRSPDSRRGVAIPAKPYGTPVPAKTLPLFTRKDFVDALLPLPWDSIDTVFAPLSPRPTTQAAGRATLPAAMDLTVATANAASRRFAEAPALPAPPTVPVAWSSISAQFHTVRAGEPVRTRRASTSVSPHGAASRPSTSPAVGSPPRASHAGGTGSQALSPRTPQAAWRQQYVRQTVLMSPATAVSVAASAADRAGKAEQTVAAARITLTPYRADVQQVQTVGVTAVSVATGASVGAPVPGASGADGGGSGSQRMVAPAAVVTNAASSPSASPPPATATATATAAAQSPASLHAGGAAVAIRAPSPATSPPASVVVTPRFRRIDSAPPAVPFTRPLSAWDTFDPHARREPPMPSPRTVASANGSTGKAPSAGKGKKPKPKKRRLSPKPGQSSEVRPRERWWRWRWRWRWWWWWWVGGWRHVLLTGAACALRWVVQEDTDDEAYRRRHIRGKDELKHRMLVAQRALEKGPNYRPRPPPRQRGPPVLPRRQSQQAANKPASPQPVAGRPRNGFQLSAAPRSQQQQEKQPKQAHAQHRVGQGVQMNGGHA